MNSKRLFTFSSTFRRFLSFESTSKQKVVYAGSINTTVKAVKVFSLSTSGIGLALQPVLLHHLMDKPLIITAITSVGCGFFILITPFLLHTITKRYVLKLEFNEESKEFCAHTLSLFNKEKGITFKASDVTVPDVPGPFTTFLIKGRPYFVDLRLFTDADAYEHLMGFDKPLDLHLNIGEDQKKA